MFMFISQTRLLSMEGTRMGKKWLGQWSAQNCTRTLLAEQLQLTTMGWEEKSSLNCQPIINRNNAGRKPLPPPPPPPPLVHHTH
jgi:hypothetical protein